jgi:hypothetical protein
MVSNFHHALDFVFVAVQVELAVVVVQLLVEELLSVAQQDLLVVLILV